MTEITAESVLEHHGIKGMKWGVRKAESSGAAGAARKVGSSVNASYSERMTKASNMWGQVAQGKGSKFDKFRTLLSTPVYKLALGQRKSYAQKQSDELKAHVERINNGQAKVKDVLTYAHNIRYVDLIKGFHNTNLH